MSEAATGKTCVVCGTDCAGKPRVKDPAGHYFCRTCYDDALMRKQSPPSAAPADDPFALNLDLIAAGAGSAAPPTAAAPCPECGTAMAAGSVICLNCGYNAQSGKHLSTKKVKVAPTRPGGGAWPTVIGVISIVFGGCGTLLNGFSLVNAILQSMVVGTLKFGLISISSSTLMTLLSLWLLVAGVGILRRKEASVSLVQRWAIVKLLLTGIVMALVAVLVSAGMEAAEDAGTADAGMMGLGMEIIVAVLLAGAVWFSLWPVFVLVWFARDKVKEDVRTWS